MKNISKTYIQYGIPNEIAEDLGKKNISITAFREESLKDLISKHKLDSTIIEFVKECITRKPIEEDIIQRLLEKSNFACCVCKGTKSDGYIIHHIVHYSKTQDNSYDNLAVLCPNDHDLAHREGIFLTKKLTEQQIRETKANWEIQVQENNEVKSIQSKSELNRIDKKKLDLIPHSLFDNKAFDILLSHTITKHTKLILIIDQADIQQEFVVYVSIKTDEDDHKWIGFGTALAIKNVYSSERVYRIGRPGQKHYEFIEYIYERIDESGLTIKGKPILVEKNKTMGLAQ